MGPLGIFSYPLNMVLENSIIAVRTCFTYDIFFILTKLNVIKYVFVEFNVFIPICSFGVKFCFLLTRGNTDQDHGLC